MANTDFSSLMKSLRSLAWRGFLLPLAGLFSAGAQETQRFPINEANGSSVEVTHVFGAVPPSGYTAVRVMVDNKGKEEVSLTMGTESTTPASRNEHTLTGPPALMACKPESTTTLELIVPLMTDFSGGGRGYQSNSLKVSLTVAGRKYNASFENRMQSGAPFWAISQSLGGAGAGVLNDLVRSKGSGSSSGYGNAERFAGSFLPAQLPSDWRGYMGLDGLALTADEWNTLAPGVRTAVRHWALLGGVLDLYHNGPVPEAILQELKAETEIQGSRRVGAGSTRTVPWDGKLLGTGETGQFGRATSAGMGPEVRHLNAGEDLLRNTKISPRATLVDALGIRSFAAWQVGLILLLFGILVGPVNLFYLAAPGRRHRLFVTTPLIALGASAVLIAVIFLQDGAGGTGRRAALLELFPDENLGSVRQYQISRTGVLFGGGFVMEEPAVVTPLMMQDTRWTRLKPENNRDSEGQRLLLPEPQAYGGEWFQSRSEQAQLVETLRPGRGRFELKPGAGDPVIVSSYSAVMEQLYYQDPNGQWWRSGDGLSTGGSAVLRQSSVQEFEAWLTPHLAVFPSQERGLLLSQRHHGKFYAVSHDSAAGFAGTLKSIAWENDLALLHGRLAPAPAPVP